MNHVAVALSVSAVLRRVFPFVVAALILLSLTFFVPYLNPFGATVLDLRGPVALFAYYLTVSGSGSFGPLTATAIVLFLVLRPGLSILRRIAEFVIIYGVVLLVIQVWVNIEPRMKAAVAMPRPVIMELAAQPAGAPALQQTYEQFYADPIERRLEHLKTILGAGFNAVPIDPRIREHWVFMTDYGFPSGHSVGAMLNAFLFLGLGYSLLPRSWQWPMYAVFAWMILIALSRTMLREHAPIQVVGGASIGIVLGLIAFLVSRGLITLFFGSDARRTTRQASAA
jgi:membrane-associated phospholipid phosphatase